MNRYDTLRAKGICVACARRPSAPERTRCEACARRASALAIKKQIDAAADGRCIHCKTLAPEPGKRICRRCLDHHGARATIGDKEARRIMQKLASRLKASGKSPAEIRSILEDCLCEAP